MGWGSIVDIRGDATNRVDALGGGVEEFGLGEEGRGVMALMGCINQVITVEVPSWLNPNTYTNYRYCISEKRSLLNLSILSANKLTNLSRMRKYIIQPRLQVRIPKTKECQQYHADLKITWKLMMNVLDTPPAKREDTTMVTHGDSQRLHVLFTLLSYWRGIRCIFVMILHSFLSCSIFM